MILHTITHSTRLAPHLHWQREPLVIRGDHIVFDGNGLVLSGSSSNTAPDQRTGTGIRIEGTDVTVKNVVVKGYKIGIYAHGCSRLTLLNCNASDNYKQHLLSTPEAENEADWQSYHHNEHNEWFRYGAGIYLDRCPEFNVKGCTVLRGQCGLMLNRSNHGVAWNNNFSFNSGLGVGMYRSSNDRIMSNRMDDDVRGYSYGHYYRGQDSAGILLFEQCNDNIIAYNSITHGGDGFFLWAGQTTMDTGKGGCNGNVVYGNDFSFAITNGIEATFSRNMFANNLVDFCWHGLWGGYSYNSGIVGNIFSGNQQGIAIEHGQDITVSDNTFRDNLQGVALWANPVNDPTFIFAKVRDVQSTRYTLLRNTYASNWKDNLNIKQTTGSRFEENHMVKAEPMGWWDHDEYRGKDYIYDFHHWNPYASVGMKAPARIKGAMDPFSGNRHWTSRENVVIGSWGPLTGQFPHLALQGKTLDVSGPSGRYRIVSATGFSHAVGKFGRTPARLLLSQGTGSLQSVVVEWVGDTAAIDSFGRSYPAGHPIRLAISRFAPNLNWTIRFYRMGIQTSEQFTPSAFDAAVQTDPILTLHLNQFNLAPGNWPKAFPPNMIAAVGDTTLRLPRGDYELDLTADDGVRALLDGRPLTLLAADGSVGKSFIWQGATPYHVVLHLDGKPHQLRVDYFQLQGGYSLQTDLKPARD